MFHCTDVNIEIYNHSIGDEGAKSFAQALRVNTSLSFFDSLAVPLVMREEIHLLRP